MNEAEIEKRTKVGKIACALILIGLLPTGIYYLYAGVDYGFLNSKISSFPARCVTSMDNKDCKYKTKIDDVAVYKVFPEQQRVVAQYMIGATIRYDKCTIIDRGNWECSINEQTFGFAGGEYWEIPENNSVKYVSKWQWSRLLTPQKPDFLDRGLLRYYDPNQ